METDECLNNNGGCWRDDKTNITACKVFHSSSHLLNNIQTNHHLLTSQSKAFFFSLELSSFTLLYVQFSETHTPLIGMAGHV
jgi:hypothetical protein